MRPFACIGALSLALAIGCLAAGYGLILPMLEQSSELVDANLAKSLGQAIAARLGLVLFLACVIVAAVSRRWTQSGLVTTLALLAMGLTGIDRLVLVPRVYRAWSRVDLVAGRPLDRLDEAVTLANWHTWTLIAAAGALVGVAILAQTLRRTSPSPSPSGIATPSQTVQNRERVAA